MLGAMEIKNDPNAATIKTICCDFILAVSFLYLGSDDYQVGKVPVFGDIFDWMPARN